MKHCTRSLILAFFIALLLSACAPAPPENDLSMPVADPTVEQAEPVDKTPWDESLIELVVLENHTMKDPNNPFAPGALDFYLRNIETREMALFASIAQVYDPNYEYVNGNLYVVLEIGDTSTADWRRELWKYSSAEDRMLLYTSKGLNFDVSADESYIAIETGEKLIIIDGAANTLKEFSLAELAVDEGLGLSLDGWASDTSRLWVHAGWGPGIITMIEIIPATWETTIHDLADLHINLTDYAPNIDTRKIVFSDHPIFFEIMSANEFSASDTPVTLFLYDLETHTLSQLAVSVAKEFQPIWLDVTTLQYDDPDWGPPKTVTIP